jgi:uncharacterized protein Veg
MSTETCAPSNISLAQSPAIVILPKEGYDEIMARVESLESNQEILFGIISRLKRASSESGKKSDLRKKALANALVSRHNAGMTYAEIGKLLELGSRTGERNTREQNMTHFGKLLEAAPKEFVVTLSKTQGGKLVKLNKIYYEHLLRGDLP